MLELLVLGSVAVNSLVPTRLASARELRHRGSRHATHCPLMTLATEEVDVLVVGGGAAGIFAAVAAARAGARVLCLEGGSKPLRKVRISGGGRCNVMHDATTWEARVGSGRDLLSERYPRGADQLLGTLTSRFSPLDTAAWFEAEGVELKVEPDGRVFPTSDDSGTVIEALLGAARRAGVELRKRARTQRVERVGPRGDGAADGDGAARFEASYLAAEAGAEADAGAGGTVRVRCAALVLATGSESHGLAAGLGHEIAPLVPSLFSFRLCAGGLLDASLAGVSHPDVGLAVQPPPPPPPPPAPAPADATAATLAASAPPAKKKRGRGGGRGGRGGRGGGRGAGVLHARGALLVTHRGVSGPAALRLSSFAAAPLAEAGYKGRLSLNLAPQLTAEEALSALQRFQSAEGTRRKQVRNVNPFGVASRLWAAVACGGSDEAVADGACKWAQLTPTQLLGVRRRACEAELLFSGKDSNKDEFVTAGGVAWSGVDSKHMQSKRVPGLFFAGELLDVDGVTGGHNFQSCWTTGMVAGTEAAKVALALRRRPERDGSAPPLPEH